jgi:hypothetical protein
MEELLIGESEVLLCRGPLHVLQDWYYGGQTTGVLRPSLTVFSLVSFHRLVNLPPTSLSPGKRESRVFQRPSCRGLELS